MAAEVEEPWARREAEVEEEEPFHLKEEGEEEEEDTESWIGLWNR